MRPRSTRAFSGAALVLLPLAPALLLAPSCKPKPPYFEGEGPELTSIAPAWENGNLGGTWVSSKVPDCTKSDSDLTDAERAWLDALVVTISGEFGDCEHPLVVFGSRAATICRVEEGSLKVLAPPGPVSGGPVDVRVTCGDGISSVPDGYDYYLGDVRLPEGDDDDDDDGAIELPPMGGERGDPEDRRSMTTMFQNEYASFALFYQAAPFINWPEPIGYGFFFNQPAPRASVYYGGNPGMFYGGQTWEETEPRFIPDQAPPVPYEAPEQGQRISGGERVTFFRARDMAANSEPLTLAARKSVSDITGGPEPHTPAAPNNNGLWAIVTYTNDSGSEANRYFRVAQWLGAWCSAGDADVSLGRLGCGSDDELSDLERSINNVRIPLDFRWNWMEPDEPGREELAAFPDASPEHIAYLDCVDGGGTPVDCEAQVGIGLPSGAYSRVRLCRSFDEFGDFPWESNGFCVPMETVDEVQLSQGGHYFDVPALAMGHWVADEDNRFYDGGAGGAEVPLGENVMIRGEPTWISWPGAYYGGDRVPPKNPSMRVPDCLPPRPDLLAGPDADGEYEYSVGGGEDCTASYDEYPYIEVANLTNSEILGSYSPFNPVEIDGREYLNFPALLPIGEDFDWRFELPGGELTDGEFRAGDQTEGDWDDTYFVVRLEVRDIGLPGGLGGTTVWQSSAWAWAGDDAITFPAETLASLPFIADVFRPAGEDSRGADLLGLVYVEVHRVASFKVDAVNGDGDDFRDPAGRAVFDVTSIGLGYFHNQHSCFDGVDNDGDGLCDLDGCDDENGNRLEPDPACIALDENDPQPSYETAVCDDGEDNDGDGLVDLEDPDCTDVNDPLEDASCSDGVDNDGDGWVDFPDDPGCASPTSSDEGGFSYLSDCNDGIDDDGDGRVDAEDPGCEDGADPDESGDTCGDGIDNNGDGWIDGADLTCRPGSTFDGEVEYTPGVANDYECSDLQNSAEGWVPKDNDGDGLINAADPDCLYGWQPTGEDTVPGPCEDRLDNDGDGWVDELDAQCAPPGSGEEPGQGLPGGTCEDGVDNDGDGWIDSLDPDCLSAHDDEGETTSMLQCNNGVDDDGDGNIDAADADCPTGKDNHE